MTFVDKRATVFSTRAHLTCHHISQLTPYIISCFISLVILQVLVPLELCKPGGLMVLSGDTNQLGPHTRCPLFP
jgi:hypothetical protein